jgi:hypothetical protein
MPSASKSTPKSAPKGRQKDTIYPILKECSTLVKDEFWRQFYEDLASAKSTKGIYISNGVIQTSNRRNGFSYSITDKAPEVIVRELHHLLLTHTSICSRKDMNKKRQIVKEIDAELKEYDKAKWTGIKRKNIRTMLLLDFAISLRNLHNLSWPATISAHQTILSAFSSKTHSSKDVHYSNGKIRGINDIELSEDGLSIENTRQAEGPISPEGEKEPENKAIMLQALFEPYVSSWIKFMKA